MSKKTITITLTEQDSLHLPNYLKKEPILDLQVHGFNDIEAMQMLVSCLSGAINNYKAKVEGIVKDIEGQTKKPN